MNKHNKTRLLHYGIIVMLLAGIGTSAGNAAGWESFVIRAAGDGTPPLIVPNDDYVIGATEFIISDGGQKAAFGTSDLDGSTLDSITSLAICRLDDYTRFTPGSGPYVAPYLNFWITDGLGNYAVVANEPSNPLFQSLYVDGCYNLSWADLADKTAKIYENSDKSWLPNNGENLTFADLAGYVIQAPTVAELSAGWAGLGPGAPDELGTYEAYGINWVFGDTLSNYVSGAEGYVVIIPTPAPTYECLGFMPPLDKPVIVKKANRVLPLRMELVDQDGVPVTDITPPVLEISYLAVGAGSSVELTEVVSAGKGDEGNQFVFDGQYWSFNLSTKGLAPGAYTLRAVSGDLSEYSIDPSCETGVIIEK